MKEEMTLISKILVMESEEPALGNLMKARIKLLRFDGIECKIIVASTLFKAKEEVENVKEGEIDVVIIGRISRVGFDEEQAIVKTLREKVPGIIILDYSSGNLKAADVSAPRPDGALTIERLVKKLIERKEKTRR